MYVADRSRQLGSNNQNNNNIEMMIKRWIQPNLIATVSPACESARRVTYILCCSDHSSFSMPRRYPSPRSSLHARCKARLPSQPASVLSIVFIDCCSTAAICEPTIDLFLAWLSSPTFLLHCTCRPGPSRMSLSCPLPCNCHDLLACAHLSCPTPLSAVHGPLGP
jgi:hypothetical protein